MVAGIHHPQSSSNEIALARFRSHGKLDSTFGGTGEVTFASGADEEAHAVVVHGPHSSASR